MRLTKGMFVLAALLLSVMVGSGQESNISPPAKFPVKRKGNNPDQKQRITYDGAALDISNAAIEQEFELEIQPLAPTRLAGLHSGMTNVTRGPRRGYRMLPNGTKFRKEILISLPYDKALLPPGAGLENIRTYFYNETTRQWEALPLVGVDAVAGTVTSATDHFTDFITSTITVPDHPQTSAFTPTQMKNVKPADPAQGISLIQPPSENNQGAAQLQSLIELPPGRNGVQPSLLVGYNSTGGNGWLGTGWNLTIPSIVIDTRWGVPRYSAAKETETYLLNGKQLTPMAHRGEPVDRTPEKIFRERVEGTFQRIVRHGTTPSNYWWEVTDKNGVRHFYGGDPGTNGPAASSTLTDGAGNIFTWSLRESRDPSGNFITYESERASDAVLADASELYVKRVLYTGHGVMPGRYTVSFIRDQDLGEPRRPDVVIDCRGGFKRVTSQLLRKVDVAFDGSLIRRYELRYVVGAFQKSLLSAIIQYGEDGTSEFYRHTFEYFDEIRNAEGGYLGFQQAAPWSVPNDGITAGLLGQGKSSALSGAKTDSRGGHLFVGIGAEPTKTNSVGVKVGYQQSRSEGLLALVDLNGDGLPDKVFKSGGSFYYRPGLAGQNGFSQDRVHLPTLPAISKDTSQTYSFGAEAHPFISIYGNASQTFSKGSTYFIDVNGDGFLDVVREGTVFFNRLVNGVPTFGPNSADTPSPIGGGTADHVNLIEDLEALYQEQIDQFPLADTLRRWVAPWDGRVAITAPVRLIPDNSQERAESITADGVRVAIQKNDVELWALAIGPNDYAAKIPTEVASIDVARGDRIYFRVGSVLNGLFDQVEWDPEITYTHVVAGGFLVPAPAMPVRDQNERNIHRTKASEDFTLAGRRSLAFRAPMTGKVRLEGTFEKLGPTTDAVRIQLLRNAVEVFGQDLAADQTVNQAVMVDLDVSVTDSLEIRVRIDSQIDLAKLRWAPKLFYVEGPPGVTLQDDQGNYLFQLTSAYSVDLYPVNFLTEPQQTWSPAADGTFTIASAVATAVGDGSTNGELILTAKAGGRLLGKGTVKILSGGVTQASFEITVAATDRVFFDLTARDPGLDALLPIRLVKIDHPAPVDDEIVPHAYHKAGTVQLFPEAFRGWSVAGYNGNRERAAAPVIESRLVVDRADYEAPEPNKAIKAYPFNPFPLEGGPQGRWRGPDDLGWAGPVELSSSRLGLDEIDVPRPAHFAGQRAPTRTGRGRQFSVGGSFDIPGLGGASGSIATGTTEGMVDYLDLNGDRFPDILGNGRVQYTLPTGALSSSAQGAGLGKIRATDSVSWNFGVGGGLPLIGTNSKGTVIVPLVRSTDGDSGTMMSTLGVSGDFGRGTSEVTEELQDVNGDGLPDRVTRTGGGLQVRLNLGYSFAAPENWGSAVPFDGESKSSSIGGNLGFNLDKYSWAAGVSLSKNEGSVKETLADLNGDGLPDRVRPAGSNLEVRFNVGGAFAAPVMWPGVLDNTIARSGDVTLGGGVYFTIPILIPVVEIYILINPGVSIAQSIGRQEVILRDVDGDGYDDHLKSSDDKELFVARNPTGKTNLLKRVRRPLGATITLDYRRSDNTTDDAHGRWVLSRSELFDGVPGDGVDTQVSVFEYQNGKFDRFEREFYGFGTVVEKDLDGTGAVYRGMTREYNTSSYYRKGLMDREVLRDGQNRPFKETQSVYTLRDVDSGLEPAPEGSPTACLFPMLARIDRRFYEGQAAPGKSSFTTHRYDALGNVVEFFDSGDAGPQDDTRAELEFSNFAGPYIVGKPTRIKAFGNNLLMRHREAVIHPVTGTITQVRQHLANGDVSITDLEYFPNGTIRSVTGPQNESGQRYALAFEYDAAISTHVVRIQDSFGYSSQASHHLKYGRSAGTTDINQNQVSYVLDKFGRTRFASAPAEFGGPNATIEFEYHPDAAVPYARTFQYDPFRNPADRIESVTFVDGLKRTLQLKKDSAIHAGPGAPAQDVMVVSGRLTFDFVGRAIEERHQTVEPLGQSGTFNAAMDPVLPTQIAFDILDRPLVVSNPDETFITYSYGFAPDRDGVVQFATTKTDANATPQVKFFDIRSLLRSVRESNLTRNQTIWTSYAYDAMKQLVEVKDDRENRTTHSYDLQGRRIAVDNPDQGKTEVTYDLAGNIVSRVTANLRPQNKKITYQFEFNRLSRILYPNFPANNVAFEYGGPGAPFNRAGRMQKITDASGTLERFYGKLGEVVKETRFVPIDVPAGNDANRTFTTQFVYDSFNRLQSMTYPDGEVLTYSYDSGGTLRSAAGVLGTQARTYVSRLEYDKFGQKAFLELGNGISTRYAYDPRSRRLDTIASAQPGQAPFQNLKYAYDNVGNMIQLESQVAVPSNAIGGPMAQSFQYDTLYRLIHAEGTFTGDHQGLQSSAYSLNLEYDTIHNIERKSQECSVNGLIDKPRSYSLTYRYQGSHPHAATTVGKREFVYDDNGNQASYSGNDDFGGNGSVTRTMVWDEEDRLVSAGGPGNGNTASFVYDHTGRRAIKRATAHELAYVNSYFTVRNRDHQMLMTKHILAGDERIAAIAFGGTLTASHQEISHFYFHADHMGSAHFLSDGAGRLRQHNEHFPFGETWISQVRDNSDLVKENAYLYTGKEFDAETSLYYFGARYYDPRTHVWQSPEPVIREVQTGSSEHQQRRMEAPLHAYGYARHNPLGYRDDTGRWAWMHHDTLIDKAFANRGPIIVSFLKSASLIADKTAFQAAWASYRHAMGAPGQKDRAATRELLLNFIVDKLDMALEAREKGRPEYEVQGQFGLGLHGVADVSSPLHGFLEWDAAGSVGEFVADIFTGRFGHAFGAIWHVVAEFFLGVWHIWLGIGDVSEKSQGDLNAYYDVFNKADKETIRGKRPTRQQLDERIRKGHFNEGWRNVKDDNQ